MDTNNSKNPVETLLKARHRVLSLREIAKVHLAIDFYLRLQADKDFGSIAPIYNTKLIGVSPLPLFGCECVVHYEPCEKEFWFEGEDGKEIMMPADAGKDEYIPAHLVVGSMPPSGYIEWHEWAEAQGEGGLKQSQCGECGLWFFPQEAINHAPNKTCAGRKPLTAKPTSL